MKLELTIATADKEPMMVVNDIRKREGDIVAVLEPDRPRGFKTLDEYLFVPAEIPSALPNANVSSLLVKPLYEGGVEPEPDKAEPKKSAKNRYQVPLSMLGDIDLVKTRDIKCIYQPFLRESSIISWPYWNREYLIMRYKGSVYEVRRTHKRKRKIYEETINGKVIRFIRPKEPALIVEVTEEESSWRPIYCNTATVGNNDEKVFEWSATKNLIKDKHMNDWLGVQAIG
jgi:hypothetical protein